MSGVVISSRYEKYNNADKRREKDIAIFEDLVFILFSKLIYTVQDLLDRKTNLFVFAVF